MDRFLHIEKGMNSWLQYLAFLSQQNQGLKLKDFENVFQNQSQIHSVRQLANYVSSEESRYYILYQKDWWKKAETHFKNQKHKKIKTVWPFHVDYPVELFKMETPPLFINWKGNCTFKDHFLFSVVGSRNPYQDTLMWLDIHLSHFLKKKKNNIYVLSGGARGVDQKAHALALAVKKPTMCFLPCGINNYYPANLKRWETPILDGGGAFISVFPPSAEMRKVHFHIRNKVLASLSHLILVAQARLRSGTMVTARYALHAGTPLAVLPSSPLYSGYGGSLSLINDGCFMVRDSLDMETLYYSCQMSRENLSHNEQLNLTNI